MSPSTVCKLLLTVSDLTSRNTVPGHAASVGASRQLLSSSAWLSGLSGLNCIH
jgi:hypothetical protein